LIAPLHGLRGHHVLAIRMRRTGSKKRPYFRLVVADSRSARDSSFVEILGHYNPRARPATVDIDRERIEYWIKKGALPSDTVRTLLARHVSNQPAVPEVKPAAPGTASGQ
jgi:small subunit ribosomal protein S16